MKQQKRTIYLVILAVILSLVVFRMYQGPKPTSFPKGTESAASNDKDFNRELDKIIYTRHGRCRMECRQIDESEIKEIRDKGKVNWSKSEPNSRPDPKYAVEGITHDQQRVRVVFAQTEDALLVVTCIDLEKEWSCDCN